MTALAACAGAVVALAALSSRLERWGARRLERERRRMDALVGQVVSELRASR